MSFTVETEVVARVKTQPPPGKYSDFSAGTALKI